MWLRFDSGLVPFYKGFFPGSLVLFPSHKPTFLNSKFRIYDLHENLAEVTLCEITEHIVNLLVTVLTFSLQGLAHV